MNYVVCWFSANRLFGVGGKGQETRPAVGEEGGLDMDHVEDDEMIT